MLSLVTAPTPFVTVAEVKRNLRYGPGNSDDDLLIADKIRIAIADLDGPTGRLGRALGLQTWDWYPDNPTRILTLPLPPLVDVLSIKDEAGVLTNPSYYTVQGINTSRGGTIKLGDAYSWPDVPVVRFQAGYADVPEPIRGAVIMMASDLLSSGGEKVDARLVEEPAIARLLSRFWVPVL